MSDDGHSRNEAAEPWPPGRRGLGPLCDACGAPLRAPGQACPACGATGASGPAHLMAPFGHGLCAFIGALTLCWALAIALTGVIPRFVFGLGPLAVASLAAFVAAQVGKRLDACWRCSYEHLLLGAMVGGPCALMAALVGVREPQALALVWLIPAAATYLCLRRWGYRAPRAR